MRNILGFLLFLSVATLAGPGYAPVGPALQGDLNGDKVKDQVQLVKVSGAVNGVKQIDGKPTKVSLLITLSGGGKYLVALPMADGPTWQKGDYKSLVKLGHGPERPKDARGESVGLFTESGAWYYYYWNGKTLVGSPEGDEP